MKGHIRPKVSIFHRLKQRVFLFRSPWKDTIQFILLIAVIVWLMSLSTSRLGYYWQWYRIPRYLFRIEEGRLVAGKLIQGLLFTFRISGVSLVLAFAIGLGTALVRLSGSFMGRILTRGYLEVIRNTPLVVQIYLVYFVVGPIIGLGRFASAVMALALFEGSYLSEILRAGIVSLHKGQWEAAHSLGLSTFDTYRDVILPQAIRRILPPLTSEVITLIKNSALVSLVSLSDLALQARVIAADTFLTFEVWFATAAIYLVVTVPLSTVVYYMEKRFKILT
ncbi:MAG: amino acid ABC transporter permease [Chloroflexi bacterium]|nr:MAG: amino acid ABC transporter permease [Chloroflexota bacterium]RLC86308.1 MAG: amino acid ABC transporter permease [Chloroflexota bacterium]